jgi:hypothetical protein
VPLSGDLVLGSVALRRLLTAERIGKSVVLRLVHGREISQNSTAHRLSP